MRRKEREITDNKEILAIVDKCKVCSLAFVDGDFPYVVPVNFGISEDEGAVSLYFHGSEEGTKMELMKINNRVSFCMSAEETEEILEPACVSTMYYVSVCGRGRIEIVESGEDKLKGLTCIMRQFDKKTAEFDFNEKAVGKTIVLKLRVEQITGKVNRKPNREA